MTNISVQAPTTAKLSLTFDDGPDLIWTARVADQLQACDVLATFFVVGSRVRASPEVTRSLLAAGHDVQLHCQKHIRHTQMSERQLAQDTEMALETLAEVGVTPTLWRSPWGVITDATVRVAQTYGLQTTRWNIDTHDWRGDHQAKMLANSQPQISDGGSVLMHDALGPGAMREGCANTVALIPGLVQTARERGIAIELLSRESLEGAVR